MSARREAIAGKLAECPPGGWIVIEECFRYIGATGNDFTVTCNAWAFTSANNNTARSVTTEARILDERYLLSLLLEYAATLA